MVLSDKERIAKLESSYDSLSATVGNIDTKLDDLLALRNKGVGAFWLATLLTGSGIVGFIELIKSHFH